jgi:hypothetical protein
MQSINHQFVEFSDQVKARYVKVGIAALSGYRLNPRNAVNPNERIEFLLATPEEDVDITPYDDGEPTKIRQKKITYANEVLELYTDTEVRSFERMNRLLIENGLLIPFDGVSDDINKDNMIDTAELKALAKQKQTALFTQKVARLTNITVLERLLELLEQNDDAKYAHVKHVKGRINELNRS